MATEKITDHDFVRVPGSRVGVEMVRCNAPRHKHAQPKQ